MTTKKFKSDLMASVHESAEALAKVGAIDKATMRGFDRLCMSRAPDFAPVQIKQIRESMKVSQALRGQSAAALDELSALGQALGLDD